MSSNSEGNVTASFVRVPADTADMHAENLSQAPESGMEDIAQSPVSNVESNFIYTAPSAQQAAAVVPVGLNPGQQTAGLPTAQPAVMAPSSMFLESGLPQSNFQMQAPTVMPMSSTSQMIQPYIGNMGATTTQQSRGIMQTQPNQPFINRLALTRVNAATHGMPSNFVNPLNVYGTTQQQLLQGMQTGYSPYNSLPSSSSYGYGPPHPVGVPDPFRSLFHPRVIRPPTPDEYTRMYYQYALTHPNNVHSHCPLNRVQNVAPSGGMSASPEPVPTSSKRKRKPGKRVSRAQIAAEDEEVARNSNNAPRAKRGRRSSKKQIDDDKVELSDDDTPVPKKRGKKGRDSNVVLKLNLNSKAFKVMSAQKLLDQPTIPATQFGWDSLVPQPDPVPSIAQVEATFSKGDAQADEDDYDADADGEEVDAMEIDPAHGGQLIRGNGGGKGTSVYDGYISKQPTSLRSSGLFTPKPTRARTTTRTSFFTMDASDEEEQQDLTQVMTQHSSIVGDYSDLTSAEKFVKFHEFFMAHFVGNRTVVQSFYALTNNCRLQQISELEYYKGVYRLIYIFGYDSEELKEHFKGLLPNEYTPETADWIHQDVAASVETNRAIGIVDEASGLQLIHGKKNGEMKRKKKTPVNGFRAGDASFAGTEEDVNADAPETDPLAPGDVDDNLPVSARDVVSPHASANVAPSSPLTDLLLSGGEDEADEDEADEEDEDEDHDESENESDGEYVLEHHEFRGARKLQRGRSSKNEDGSLKPRAGQLYASQIKHVGPVYKTRRAILVRDDR